MVLAVLLASCGGSPLAAHSSTTTQGTTSTSSAPSVVATWKIRTAPQGVGDLNDVACPSETQCYAAGGVTYGTGPGWVIGSSNGGSSWEILNTAPESWFSAIACPTTTTCVVAGGAAEGGGDTKTPILLVTNDSGEHWSNESMPSQIGSILDVACASLSTCVAVGNDNKAGGSQTGIARTSDGGALWTMVSPPTGLGAINSVTCTINSFCIIGGAGSGPESNSPSMASVSHDAGASWSAGVIAGGTSSLGEISCTETQHCVGLIGSGATNSYGIGLPTVTSDGGMTWQEGSSRVGQAVSCVSDFCVSVGGVYAGVSSNTYPADAFVSTDSGSDWAPMQISTSASLTAVVCLSKVDCVAVGGNFPNSEPAIIASYSA